MVRNTNNYVLYVSRLVSMRNAKGIFPWNGSWVTDRWRLGIDGGSNEARHYGVCYKTDSCAPRQWPKDMAPDSAYLACKIDVAQPHINDDDFRFPVSMMYRTSVADVNFTLAP